VTGTRWAAVGFGLAFLAVVAYFVVASIALDDSTERVGSLRVPTTGAAVAPFEGLTVTRLELDGACKHLVVADDLDEREAGLRDRTDPSPYAGMLFVFDTSTDATFTMAGVSQPLEIGFYDADGGLVSRTRMEPCKATADRCPVYRADGSFRYALEVAAGHAAPGSLANCPS